MKPRISIKETKFTSSIQEVWDIVTDNTKYKWRSDLDKIIIVNDNVFIEKNKNGAETKFYITKKEEPNYYNFDLESDIFTGKFTCQLTKDKDSGTNAKFVEEIVFKNIFYKLLSYLFLNLKNVQQTYVNDLKKELKEEKIIDMNKEKKKEDVNNYYKT